MQLMTLSTILHDLVLKGSSTFVNSYGFLVDHAHEARIYMLTMRLLLVLITQMGFVRGHYEASNFACRISAI